MIMDGTAHPTKSCPYDTGKEYLNGEEDYATWQEKILLQGCQSFDGATSLLLRCSETTKGITMFTFNNPTCDVDGVIGGEEMFEQGIIECNYATGTGNTGNTGSGTTGTGTTGSTATDTTAITFKGPGSSDASRHNVMFCIVTILGCIMINIY